MPQWKNLFFKLNREFLGWPVVRTQHFPLQGARVRPLVGELRSHVQRGVTKSKQNKMKQNKTKKLNRANFLPLLEAVPVPSGGHQ